MIIFISLSNTGKKAGAYPKQAYPVQSYPTQQPPPGSYPINGAYAQGYPPQGYAPAPNYGQPPPPYTATPPVSSRKIKQVCYSNLHERILKPLPFMIPVQVFNQNYKEK